MTAEQRAREDAVVLAALPMELWQIAAKLEDKPGMICLFTGDTRRARNSVNRLKRAGKAQFNGKGWEAVCPQKVCRGCGSTEQSRADAISRSFLNCCPERSINEAIQRAYGVSADEVPHD